MTNTNCKKILSTSGIAILVAEILLRYRKGVQGQAPEEDEYYIAMADAIVKDMRRGEMKEEEKVKQVASKQRSLLELIDSIQTGKEPVFINKLQKDAK